jgi:membrane protease YdiL (CAAX protease family)
VTAAPAGPVDQGVRFPLRALWLVAGAIVVSLALGIVVELVLYRVLDLGRSVTILGGLASVWVSLGGACVIASRRYGSGHTFRDLGVSFQWRDLLRGPVITFLALVAVAFASSLLGPAGNRFHGSNASLLKAPRGDVIGAVLLVLGAVVGAPFFEEMFFRGLLLRTLESRLSRGAATVGQALLFGLVHFQVILGWGNVGVIVAVGTIGYVFGLAVQRFRRVGPTVIAHGAFNGFVAIVVYASRH